jgi:DNA-binding response OmpR family regulator
MAKILVIDDEPYIRAVIRLTLSQLGHAVVEAGNGAEGLNILRKSKFDLVITDIVMPEKEGLEVLMELQRAKDPVGVIAISGGGRGSAMDYLHTATLLGAKQVLTKPFNTEVLLAAVNEVLADQNAIPEKPSETVASNTMSD